MQTSRFIDVHHHILPPEYVERVGYINVGAQGSFGRVPEWSRADALENMDRADIASAIASMSSRGVSPIAGAAVIELARWCNEFAAGMVQDHPNRFGMFATLPCADMDAALEEVSFAYEQLAADGVCLLTNYEGIYLGEGIFHPLQAYRHYLICWGLRMSFLVAIIRSVRPIGWRTQSRALTH